MLCTVTLTIRRSTQSTPFPYTTLFRSDQFDGIATEDNEVSNILLPPRDIPGVVGIGLGPVTELVSAQPVSWRGCDAEIVRQRDGAGFHAQCAQQMSDAEQHAARVVADDENQRRAFASFDANPITFRPFDFLILE